MIDLYIKRGEALMAYEEAVTLHPEQLEEEVLNIDLVEQRIRDLCVGLVSYGIPVAPLSVLRAHPKYLGPCCCPMGAAIGTVSTNAKDTDRAKSEGHPPAVCVLYALLDREDETHAESQLLFYVSGFIRGFDTAQYDSRVDRNPNAHMKDIHLRGWRFGKSIRHEYQNISRKIMERT